MYGIQTILSRDASGILFENDVNMYGIQTASEMSLNADAFENDVNMYGIQTILPLLFSF